MDTCGYDRLIIDEPTPGAACLRKDNKQLPAGFPAVEIQWSGLPHALPHNVACITAQYPSGTVPLHLIGPGSHWVSCHVCSD